MKKTLLKSLALAAVGSLFMVGSAMALPQQMSMMEASATGTSNIVYIGDELTQGQTYTDTNSGVTYTMGGNDTAMGALGVVGGNSNGVLFGDFTYASGFGVSKPQDGSSAIPMMHLHAGATTKSSGTITFKFTTTDFGPMANGLTGFLTGFAANNGVQNLKVYYDTTNILFGEGTQIADLTSSGGFQSLSSIYSGIPATNPFSMTMVGTIILSHATGSFDGSVAPVPEPATMLLLGTGLAGIAGLRRRKSKKV